MMDREGRQGEKTNTQESMEIYRRLGTPGAPHRLLASLEGSWHASTKSFVEPGKPPVESSGTSEQKMILGGRFLRQEFSGDMAGTPFSGFGLTGFDNHKQRYVSIWTDSMRTGILFFEGTAYPGGNGFIQECRVDDPARGPIKWRSVTRVLDDDTHLFEMYGTFETGKEEKMMDIAYTRKR